MLCSSFALIAALFFHAFDVAGTLGHASTAPTPPTHVVQPFDVAGTLG